MQCLELLRRLLVNILKSRLHLPVKDRRHAAVRLPLPLTVFQRRVLFLPPRFPFPMEGLRICSKPLAHP